MAETKSMATLAEACVSGLIYARRGKRSEDGSRIATATSASAVAAGWLARRWCGGVHGVGYRE